jgi:predicted P-loop ATPase
MAEPAQKVLREIETFRAIVRSLDDEGFKKEVAKIAVVQPENVELRDAIAGIAAGEFGGGGKQTVLEIWASVQSAASNAHTQVARAGATGLFGFHHVQSPTGIAQSLENALLAMEQLNLDCRYDLFHDKIIVKGYDSGRHRGDALEDLDNIGLKVRQAILMRFGFDAGKNFVLDALKMRAFDHMFDPVCDYLDSVHWDGVPRLDTWLVVYCGSPDTPLTRAIGRKMLIAAARRARKPGCKFDQIIVFESLVQGVGKSTAFRILAGDGNFSDAEILGMDKQDQQEAMQGIWIYEIAELEGLTKAEVTKVKLFASKTHDMARPAYGRHRVDRPRRGILTASTNDDKYLRDTTGNRRFWPVKTPKIDLASIERNRDRLWAEAAAAEATGEGLVIPETLWPEATAQQLARMEIDPWEEVLANKLAENEDLHAEIDGCFTCANDKDCKREWRVSTNYLLSRVLMIPKDRQTGNHAKRLAAVMRNLGWTRPDDPFRIGLALRRGFTKPALALGVTPSQPENVLPLIPPRRSGSQEGVGERRTDLKNVTGVTKNYRRF